MKFTIAAMSIDEGNRQDAVRGGRTHLFFRPKLCPDARCCIDTDMPLAQKPLFSLLFGSE